MVSQTKNPCAKNYRLQGLPTYWAKKRICIQQKQVNTIFFSKKVLGYSAKGKSCKKQCSILKKHDLQALGKIVKNKILAKTVKHLNFKHLSKNKTPLGIGSIWIKGLSCKEISSKTVKKIVASNACRICFGKKVLNYVK